MAAKAKNPKKQQQAVATVMVTPNPFVVPDEIFSKIFTAAASSILDMDGNSSGTSPKMGQDQPLAVLPNVVLSGRSLPIPVAKQSINSDDLKDWADQMEMESTVPPPVSGVSDAGAWVNVNGRQRFSGWVASNFVPGATYKIKMALLSSLFQLLSGFIGLKSVLRDAVKLFCVEFVSQECLNGTTKVAISDKVFLTILKIVQSSGVASVFFPSLSVTLCNVPLDASSDNIKSALGIFDIFSAAAVLSNWSVLVRKDSIRILPIANQKEVISSRDAFKAKLVNLPFGCTAFEISDLVSQVGGHTCFIHCFPDFYQRQCFAVVTFGSLESLDAAVSKTGTLYGCRIWWETLRCHRCYRCQSLDHLAVNCKVLPPFPPKLSSNSAGGPIIFKSSLVGAKSYAKATTSVVPPVAAAADTGLAFSTSKIVVLLLPIASSGSDVTVNARLASLETQLSELSLLIKSIVEPVGSLVALVTMLLSTPPVMAEAMKEKYCLCCGFCAAKGSGGPQVKEWEDDDDDDDDDGDAKDFLVYDNTFDAMIELFGSVNTSSGDNTPFKIANTSKRTALHRQTADFSPITANRLEKKTNKKYRHIGRISIKGLTEKFNQVIKKDLFKNTIIQTNNFVLQLMFNKCENSNKFQIKAWTSKKKVSKSLKKLDKPSKATKRDSKKAAQIETALRKCNPNILNRINSGNSLLEIEKQMDNLFVANKDKTDLDNTIEDMKDSELGLFSRIESPNLRQYSSKSLGKKPMFMEPNHEEG
ncbi:hypothetical protein G9A89_018654 [Geosiphon pyriformis]|nr:hypothetical protein G9A89_018654 [Geosiphon pyriformis]